MVVIPPHAMERGPQQWRVTLPLTGSMKTDTCLNNHKELNLVNHPNKRGSSRKVEALPNLGFHSCKTQKIELFYTLPLSLYYPLIIAKSVCSILSIYVVCQCKYDSIKVKHNKIFSYRFSLSSLSYLFIHILFQVNMNFFLTLLQFLYGVTYTIVPFFPLHPFTLCPLLSCSKVD